jgi:predicted nucleic-acid-binding protein
VPRRARDEAKTQLLHLLDTNVILRFLIGDDPPKAARATRLMERVERNEAAVEISQAVITETVWTLEKHYQVPRDEISEKLIGLLNFPGVRVVSRDTFVLAFQHFADSRADFVDCLLVADSKLRKVPVYTFDETDFRKLGADWERP